MQRNSGSSMNSSQRRGTITTMRTASVVLIALAALGISVTAARMQKAGIVAQAPVKKEAAQKPAPAKPSPTKPSVSPTHAADMEKDYPVRPVPFTSVHVDDAFWLPKIETNRQVTIPFAFQQCELSGRVDNFIRAATALKGEELTNRKPPGY